MNTSVEKIASENQNDKILSLTAKMLAWTGKKMKVVFEKSDKSLRTMIFTTAANWNGLNGIETTRSGRKMLDTKCNRGIATVIEILGNGLFQPRSIPLGKVISLELV